MAAAMTFGTGSTAALPAGVTPRQIDENLPHLAGFNSTQYDTQWDHLVSNSVGRNEAVMPAR